MSENTPQNQTPQAPQTPQVSQAPQVPQGRRDIRPWLIAALLLAIAGGVALGVMWPGGDDGPGTSPALDSGPPEPAWVADPTAPAYQLTFAPGTGPRVATAQGAPLADLGLRWIGHYGEADGEGGCAGSGTCMVQEELPLTGWAHAEDDGVHTFTAAHQGANARVEATWTLRPGDPRVRLEARVEWLADATPDREALELTLHEQPAALGRDLKFAAVPNGKRALLDRTTPHRLIAGAGERAFQLNAWGLDAMEIIGEGTGARVVMEIDDARNHPFRPLADCAAEATGEPRRVAQDRLQRAAGQSHTISAELWLGHTWGPAVTRLPEGRQAALAMLEDSAGVDLNRATALLSGHSDPNNPRYGNGGVLSRNLGLTMTVGSQDKDLAGLMQLARETRELGVRFARRADAAALGATDPLAGLEATTWVDTLASCADFHGDGWRKAQGAANPESPYALVWSGLDTRNDSLNMLDPGQRAARPSTLWTHNRAGRPLTLFRTLDMTAGRGELRRRLTQASLEGLIDERGLTLARVAMTSAGRGDSPLGQEMTASVIPDKERPDHFIPHPDLETILADISAQAEEQALLWVVSVEALAQRLEATAQVRLRPQADGRLRVFNPTDAALKALTLSLPGKDYTIVIEGGQLGGQRTLELPRGQQETWAWFDLPAGDTAIVTITDPQGYRLQPLIPVRWEIALQRGETAHVQR